MDPYISYATSKYYAVSKNKTVWEYNEFSSAYDAILAQNPTNDECKFIIQTGRLPERFSENLFPNF
jgi:hypothetical protein